MGFLIEEIKSAYNEKPMKNYVLAKIYHGGKTYDLTKRWYVYYSFQNPSTQYPDFDLDINTVHSIWKVIKEYFKISIKFKTWNSKIKLKFWQTE